MNKQELIKFIEKLPFSNGPIADTVTVNREWILSSIEQLDEPQKVKIPKFVAECIEYAQASDWDLEDVFLNIANKPDTSEISEWFYSKSENMDTLASAWLYGYEIEKEKRYIVKMKGVVPGSVYLKHETKDNYWYFGTDSEKGCIAIKHTKKQLEEAGFGWVFNCPGIEIEVLE